MRGSLNCQKASMTTMSERQSYLQVDIFVRLPWSLFMLYSLTARGAQTGWWQRRWLCLGGRPPANQTLRSSWLLWRLTTDQAEQVESFGGQPVTGEGGAGQALLPQPVCKVKVNLLSKLQRSWNWTARLETKLKSEDLFYHCLAGWRRAWAPAPLSPRRAATWPPRGTCIISAGTRRNQLSQCQLNRRVDWI